MAEIIDFIADLSFEDIPAKALQAARYCLLDAVGCMVGGMQNQEVIDLATNISRKNQGLTKIAGTSLTCSRPWASFINSHACSYYDLDDGHRKAQGHPGGVIIPVTFMLAAENGRSGKELLAAIVAGYETAVRSAQVIRQAGGPRKGSGGWNITGGVAAAAKLCGLSKPQIKNALGLAEYYAPQAPQDRSLAYPSSMKEGMAWAAHVAISVVELAEADFDGMLPSLTHAEQCDDLGSNWEVCSTYFKMYACCRFSHPALDGLTTLVEENEVKVEDIKSIRVVSFSKALLLNHLFLENPVAAMYSIPFIIGCFLVKGKVGTGEMTADTLKNPEIMALAGKVVLEEDPALTDLFPLQCLARVSVTLNNGKSFKSETLSAKGDPDNPYSSEEMRAKFLDLTMPLLGKYSQTVYDQIMNIEHEDPQALWHKFSI
jgi:2-methylcitrate dehydratase PrpD